MLSLYNKGRIFLDVQFLPQYGTLSLGGPVTDIRWSWFPLTEAHSLVSSLRDGRLSGLVLDSEAMAKSGPFEFIQQVRQEANKVTWPTRKEVGITTVMVFVMVVVAAIFFFVVDQIIRLGVQTLLSLGS